MMMMVLIMMTIVRPGTQVHRMMNLDTLPPPRDQTRTGLKGRFCHRHHRLHHHHNIYFRALFGPTDHEENLRFVRKELKKAKNEAANKW